MNHSTVSASTASAQTFSIKKQLWLACWLP